jgi:hypothetical protein
MEPPNVTHRETVELPQTDWDSIITILQVQAKQEHHRGNDETAKEIRLFVDRIASQL